MRDGPPFPRAEHRGFQAAEMRANPVAPSRRTRQAAEKGMDRVSCRKAFLVFSGSAGFWVRKMGYQPLRMHRDYRRDCLSGCLFRRRENLCTDTILGWSFVRSFSSEGKSPLRRASPDEESFSSSPLW